MGKRNRRKPAATPPAAPLEATAKAGDFKPGDLVQFYCPAARAVVQEKVTGQVEAHGYVTVESGRHFPAKELTPVASE